MISGTFWTKYAIVKMSTRIVRFSTKYPLIITGMEPELTGLFQKPVSNIESLWLVSQHHEYRACFNFITYRMLPYQKKNENIRILRMLRNITLGHYLFKAS